MKKILLSLLVLILTTVVGAVPRSEYPRPQFQRADWQCLNGTWNFAFDFGQSGRERNWQKATSLERQITVPFCPERPCGIKERSAFPLSGLAAKCV